MIKFAVTLTKGDNRKVLEVCGTKEQAMEKGAEYRKKLSMNDGALSCISADFDENNNRTDNKYNLIHCWL